MRTKTSANSLKGAVMLAAVAVIAIGCGSSPESNAWQTKAVKEDGTVSGCPTGTVLVAPAEQVGQDVRIHMVDTLCRDKECRIVAVDNTGQTILGRRTARILEGGNCRSTKVVFPDTRLEDIEQFNFESRPYQRETVRGDDEAGPAVSAARKAQLIEAAGTGDLFESSYFNLSCSYGVTCHSPVALSVIFEGLAILDGAVAVIMKSIGS